MVRWVLAFLLLCGPAFAHHWYPHECCHGQDCYEISASEIRLTKEGAYLVIQSGEIFAHPDSQDPIRKARFSPDGKYHRCTPSGDRESKYSICLFVPRAADS